MNFFTLFLTNFIFIFAYTVLYYVYLFSGYFKGHSLKYQTTLFPNGMVAGVFGAAGAHNDVAVLNLSGLVEYLENVLHPDHKMNGGLLPAFYAEAILLHIIHMTIITHFNVVGNMQEQAIICKLNFRMSSVRQSIVHMYGALFNLFNLIKTPCQIKLFNDGQTAYCLGVIWFYSQLLHLF